MDFKKEEVKKEETRFYWKDDDPKSAWIDVVPLTLEDIQRIRKECTRIVRMFAVDPKDGQSKVLRDSEFDNERFSEKCNDEMLVSWGGFSVNGKTLECNPENKTMMIRDFKEFADFYNKCTAAVNKELLKQFGGDSEAKNSKSTRRKR